MPVHEGYRVWCAGCDWNVAPELFVYGAGGTAERRRDFAGRHGTATFEELAREGTQGLRARLTPSSVLAGVLALLVHGLSFVLLGVGAWLLVAGWGNPFAVAFGALLVLTFLVLRPASPGSAERHHSSGAPTRPGCSRWSTPWPPRWTRAASTRSWWSRTSTRR